MVTVGRIVRPHGNGDRSSSRRRRTSARSDSGRAPASARASVTVSATSLDSHRQPRARRPVGRRVRGRGVDRRRRGAARARAANPAETPSSAAQAGRVLRARPGRLRGDDDGRRAWSARRAGASSTTGDAAAGGQVGDGAKCWCRSSRRSAGAWMSRRKSIVIDPPEGLIELNRRRERGRRCDRRRHHDFPGDGRGGAAEGVVGRARARGLRRHPRARLARLHRRSASDGRRRAVRRRARAW